VYCKAQGKITRKAAREGGGGGEGYNIKMAGALVEKFFNDP